MIANYHTHTPRCGHARGGEWEYVETAVERGLKILGFSDHSPCLFDGSYYSNYRMRPEQLEDYVKTVLTLRDRYEDKLEIHVGVEIEYYPAFWERTVEFLRGNGVEYLILGQHFLDNEINAHYSGSQTAREEDLEKYCFQAVTAMETGLITYFAHPDLIRFEGEDAVYERHIRQLCRDANRLQVPLEINFLGLHENRFYPHEPFWKIAGEEKCTVIFGADAHSPESVCDPEDVKKARMLAEKYDLRITDSVKLRNLQQL